MSARPVVTQAERDEALLTALCKSNDVNLVRVLLSAGANPNARQNEWTCLHVAAANGYTEIAVALIAAGGKVDACTEDDDRTPLFWASAKNHHDTVKALLAAGADANRGAIQTDGWGPLHVAAKHAVAAVAALLAEGADPNAKGSGGVTPLWVAAAAHNAGAVRLLLDAGADPNAIGNNGKVSAPPLVAAAMAMAYPSLMIGTTKTLASDKTANIPMQMLLTAGADATARATIHWEGYGPSFTTALHCAAEAGAMDVTEALLASDASTAEVFDGNGMLPLHAAAYNADHTPNAEKVGMFLLDRTLSQQNTQWPDVATRSALHLAAGSGATELCEMILAKNVDPSAKDSEGETPLHYAVRGGHVGAVRALVRAGADVNAARTDGCLVIELLSEVDAVPGRDPRDAIASLLREAPKPSARLAAGVR